MSIPYSGIGTTPRRANTDERDRAAIVLASYLQSLLDFCPDYFHPSIRTPLVDRIGALRASQGLPQAPLSNGAPSTIGEAMTHLRAALAATTGDHDAMDHVRKAHALLGGGA